MESIWFKVKVWWYKQTHFEFFSIPKLYFPIALYALFVAIQLRDFYWIKYVNPRIYLSGIVEHSKNYLLKKIPSQYSISSVFGEKGISLHELVEKITKASLEFPLVIKPDCGSRGLNIYKVTSFEELEQKYDNARNYVIQEYADYKNEYAVFYIRYPNEPTGKVTSLVQKEFMKFIGDGNTTLWNLISHHPRAWLYTKRMQEVFSNKELASVVPKDKVISASFVGAHSGGTIFLDKNHLITEKISRVFDAITQEIPEFYYGRYDVKAHSLKDLENGNFKVLELNGALGEPVHMYHPGTSITKGYSILFSNWFQMSKIARLNKKRGVSVYKKT
ncbi:MAG: hypothetical protein MRY57_03925 [Candidatus Pacebacteria bacterium]|nr:hypothetical protein [Candidatus Paceibacterota bacterium]